MHNKVFVIDNSTVITGSFNPSNNADKKNDENIMIINDERIALLFLNTFDEIYNHKEFVDEEKEVENIVIDEIMYDPEGKDTGNEYVVLYNFGNNDVDVNYWKIGNNKSTYVLKGIIAKGDYMKIIPKFSA